MSSSTGWPRGRMQWLFGTIVLLGLGALVGLLLQNIWLGLLLAAIIAIGWLIAYESWRGRNVGMSDEDGDDGARL